MVFVCFQSTESDLSLESDDLATYTNVSFAEFLQQYKELSDWLNHIEAATKVNVSSLSEKYLNQVCYHGNVIVEIKRKGTYGVVYYVVIMCRIDRFFATLPCNRDGRLCFKIIPILTIIPILKMLPMSDDFPCFGRGLKFCNSFFRSNKYKTCAIFQMSIQL